MKTLLHSGNIILAGFAGMILFMSYLVFQCIQNPSALVSDNYYEQELTYQNVIDAKQDFADLQQNVTIKKEDEQILLCFPDTLNNKVIQTNFTFYNVANSKSDYQFKLLKNSEGIYRFKLSDFVPGSYRVKMQIEAEHQQNYYHEIPVAI